jgi:hypothetical protein
MDMMMVANKDADQFLNSKVYHTAIPTAQRTWSLSTHHIRKCNDEEVPD